MMTVHFQSAQTSDIPLLLTLMRLLYESDGTMPFNAESARYAVAGLLAQEAFGRIWLIQVAGEAIGYVVLTLGYSLEYGGRDAFIDELYIGPQHRHQGIGKQTVAFLETICTALGVHALHLEVERRNAVAQGLYQRLGFSKNDRDLMTKWLAE